MNQLTIDINADLGEGTGNDGQIMPLISSCNIACGGHVGNEASIRTAIRLAKKYQVKIGAHPSFPDRENFGRKMLDLSTNRLQVSLEKQLSTFQEICYQESVEIHHIKPHGALYNQGANDRNSVDAMINVFKVIDNTPTLYLQQNSLLHQATKGVSPIKIEAFIDRTYADEHTLVNRNSPNSIINDPVKAWKQLYSIFKNHKALNNFGNPISIEADTFCIHGDHANAVTILNFIHQQLKENGIQLA